MTEEQAKAWVKDKSNQQRVLKAFFKKHPPKQLRIAIFMAGIPGAGKTEFAENVIKTGSPGLISIEHDELVEYIDGYTPEEYYTYRKAGSVLVTLLLEECLRNGYAFIFDGTLSHENGKKNIEKCLKQNYWIIVIYIMQDTALAWQLTQARELIKKRAIERQGFIETCSKINANLLAIFEQHKTDSKFEFWIIDKGNNPDSRHANITIHNQTIDAALEIENQLNKPYNKA